MGMRDFLFFFSLILMFFIKLLLKTVSTASDNNFSVAKPGADGLENIFEGLENIFESLEKNDEVELSEESLLEPELE